MQDDNFNQKLEASETLSRFILDARDIKGDCAKPRAFKPTTKHNDLSVYRIKNCQEDLIWQISIKYVNQLRGDDKEVCARADFNIDLLKKFSCLKLNPDGKPYKRHLNIENWPLALDNKILLAEIKAELANNSKVVKVPII